MGSNPDKATQAAPDVSEILNRISKAMATTEALFNLHNQNKDTSSRRHALVAPVIRSSAGLGSSTFSSLLEDASSHADTQSKKNSTRTTHATTNIHDASGQDESAISRADSLYATSTNLGVGFGTAEIRAQGGGAGKDGGHLKDGVEKMSNKAANETLRRQLLGKRATQSGGDGLATAKRLSQDGRKSGNAVRNGWGSESDDEEDVGRSAIGRSRKKVKMATGHATEVVTTKVSTDSPTNHASTSEGDVFLEPNPLDRTRDNLNDDDASDISKTVSDDSGHPSTDGLMTSAVASKKSRKKKRYQDNKKKRKLKTGDDKVQDTIT